ncbi:MAG: sodium:solute symporter [Deltaproteobacteria bacterium]|nr:sodium:solute symporter [Deltaproteobacteria bacterium]
MTVIDWVVLSIYIIAIIGMSAFIGRRQKSQEDYYLGGRAMPSWQVGLSIIATQVSAISLVGAPAFIAIKGNGGLLWLQYEFAIPLAMMGIMLIMVPLYHRTRAITIYEYLEKRFGRSTRMSISAVFLVSRGLGSGVALLATAIVTAVCLKWPLWETILLIGGISIIYTTFGGIVADIYSDIIQLIILWGGSLLAIVILFGMLDSEALSLLKSEPQRLRVFDFSATGLGDGKTFGFWPMLIGGFFLYLSYYGCDQSQAQRLLTTATPREAQKALLMNGVLRFLLVLTYCAFGVLLIPFLLSHPEFAHRLQEQQPDFLVPYFLMEYFPKGILGILIAGFFAASMSSIDSALNSLSAATYQDFLVRIFPKLSNITDAGRVRFSRWLTVFWGIVATGFALQMIGGPETVLELVNKIGSAFYGPILAVFWLGILTRRGSESGAISGLAAGVGFNIFLWQFRGSAVSWLWWNVFGFLVSFGVGYGLSTLSPPKDTAEGFMLQHGDLVTEYLSERKYYWILTVVFLLILLIGFILQKLLSSG